MQQINFIDKTILAPLAGITNLPFRLIAKKCGAEIVCSEMISSAGLVYNNSLTKRYLDTKNKEKPISFQIFGSKKDIMAEAAILVENAGADILDINFGCTARKVMKTGAGASLMADMKNARDIICAVRKVIKIPLTIKIRSGFYASGEDAINLAKMAEGCGADAIVVHPRTISQRFTGKADWNIIKKIKKELQIPVIGNGDINSASDAIKMIKETNCDSVMVGRASIGNPYIFREISSAIKNKPTIKASTQEQFAIMKKYIVYSINYFGEKNACKMMRSRLAFFAKGMSKSKSFRKKLVKISTQKEAFDLLDQYQQQTIC